MTTDPYITASQTWVESIVIKHNFCPFAHKPARQNLIRYTVCLSDDEQEIINVLIDELHLLRDADPKELETSILITPNCLNDFHHYNQFLDVIDVLLKQFNLEGIIQVASFHPDYQFADLDPEDVRNYTNRSPYPMFHLILEDSIEKARMSQTDTESIPQKNMNVLIANGLESAKKQLADCYKKHSSDNLHD